MAFLTHSNRIKSDYHIFNSFLQIPTIMLRANIKKNDVIIDTEAIFLLDSSFFVIGKAIVYFFHIFYKPNSSKSFIRNIVL